jgi:membrane-bound serine protease (ClpP class)
MAPATNTGAATPIQMEGGEVIDKVIEDFTEYTKEIAEHRERSTEFAEDAVREGRSAGATEAIELGVADLVAGDLATLLEDIDGTTVTMGEADEATLSTAGAAPVDFEMSWTRRILQALANPNLAFIFFALAPLAILWEIANPGMGLGAIAGAIMLILALYSLAVLPVNLAGLALLAIAIVLFIIEAFVPGIGVAAGGGAAALVLAGLFLFQRPTGIGVDWWVIAPTVVFTALIAIGLAVLVRRTWAERPTTGEEAYSGARAEVRTWDVETGQRVATLAAEQPFEAGDHELAWCPTAGAARDLAAGFDDQSHNSLMVKLNYWFDR